ncbi:MAG: dynamin family protein [Cetobacterium sp.]|uniref:dynamin family protein n=1 Tax=Cetobacterium sp. TaxID=2071632 RepID=UPI003EE4C628
MALRVRDEKSKELKKVVKLDYNPYYIRTTIDFENIQKDRLTKAMEILKLNENEILQSWIHKFLEALFLELNTDSLDIKFEGREIDCRDIQEILEKYPATNLKYDRKYQDEKLKTNFLKSIEDFKEIIHEHKLNIDISKYSTFFTSEVKVAVMAPMSSGKSTFLNALIGHEILPSEHAACTARIFEIINNKNLQKGEFECRVLVNSEPLFDWSKVTQTSLKELNESELPENAKIEIAGNIPFLSNENYNIRLIDTPGPNNNNNSNHRAESLDFIKNENDCLVIYVLDSTNLTTNDSGVYIEEISNFLNKNEGNKNLSEKIIFILNKFDNLSVAKGEDKKIFQEANIFLRDKGIKNPKIFPISSFLVKSLRKGIKNMNEVEMDDETYEEWQIYQGIEAKFKNIRSQMNTLNFVPFSESIKASWSTEEENKKLENLSGITAIEYYIHRHINRYYLVRKMNNVLKKFLADINLEYQKLNLKREEDTDTIQNMKNAEVQKSKKMDDINLFIINFDIKLSLNKIDQAYTKYLYKPFQDKKRDIIEKNGNMIEKEEAKKLYDEIERDLKIKNDQFKSELKGIYNELKDKMEVEVVEKLKEYVEDFNHERMFDNFLLDLKIEIDKTEIDMITEENKVKFELFNSSTWKTLLWTQIEINHFLKDIESYTQQTISKHQLETQHNFEEKIKLFKEECKIFIKEIIEKISLSIIELDKKDKNIQELQKIEYKLVMLKNKIKKIVE